MSDQPQKSASPPPESGSDLGARLLRRNSWSERVLSPWLQRQRQAEAVPPAALTVSHTTHLLARLQRAADESLIWRPDVGSLNPRQVERFTAPIAARFPAYDDKYQADPREAHTDIAALPLAGGPGRGDEESEIEPEGAVEPTRPSLPFTMDQVKQALENRSWADWGEASAPASPAALPPAPAPVQRQPSPKPSGNRPLPFSVAEVRAALEQPH
ncbi:MAG: hypothetical protein KDF65_07245, partial [Anaerolineae bacterium]|nr:hypothetical protein [Anaerolineae bacterium]